MVRMRLERLVGALRAFSDAGHRKDFWCARVRAARFFRALRGPTDLQRDECVPRSELWRRLLVLAHEECNRRKSDSLADVDALERWLRRNEDHGLELASACDELRLPHDWPTLRRVAISFYRQAEADDASLWRPPEMLVPVNPRWRTLFGAA